MARFVTWLPPVDAAVTLNVNDAGRPDCGDDVGGVIKSVGAARIETVTVPDVCPVVGVVPVPPVPPVAPVAPVAPTVAVTVACVCVERTVVATPFRLVLTSDWLRVPADVVNETGAALNGLPLMSKTVAVIVDEPPDAGI